MPSLSEETQKQPRPRRSKAYRMDQIRDLPFEEKDRITAENEFTAEGNARRKREAVQEKLHACPTISVTLNMDKAIASASLLQVNLVLRYEEIPNGDDLAIVLRIPSVFFGRSANLTGHYQLFADPPCSTDSHVPLTKAYRRPRDENGRFIHIPDERISSERDWIKMKTGDEVNRSEVLDISHNRDWKTSLVSGQDYWLQYGVPESAASIKMPSIQLWRFGLMEGMNGQHVRFEASTWIPISLGPSNPLEFHLQSTAS